MKADNVTFKSKINFVSEKAFDKFRHGAYADVRRLQTLPEYSIKCRAGMTDADEFYTDEVRTCTAGGLINTKTRKAIGFHYYDDLSNLQNLEKFLKYLFDQIKEPDRALLIGGKNLKYSNYSLPIFDKFKEVFSKKIKILSVFQEHLFPFSESNIHYSAPKDEWTIHSMFRPKTGIVDNDLTSPDLFDCCFREIKIADGDSLFVDEKQVIDI